MAQPQLIYEQQYFKTGWFDASGKTLPSWWNRDLASGEPGTVPPVIPLDVLEPGFFDDPDVIFLLDGGPGTPIPVENLPPGFEPTSGIYVQLTHPVMFLDDDLFFHPMSVRALDPPDQFLKNEVRRIR